MEETSVERSRLWFWWVHILDCSLERYDHIYHQGEKELLKWMRFPPPPTPVFFPVKDKILSHGPNFLRAVRILCSLLLPNSWIQFWEVAGFRGQAVSFLDIWVAEGDVVAPWLSALQTMTTGSLTRTMTPMLCSTPAASWTSMVPALTATPSCSPVTWTAFPRRCRESWGRGRRSCAWPGSTGWSLTMVSAVWEQGTGCSPLRVPGSACPEMHFICMREKTGRPGSPLWARLHPSWPDLSLALSWGRCRRSGQKPFSKTLALLIK